MRLWTWQEVLGAFAAFVYVLLQCRQGGIAYPSRRHVAEVQCDARLLSTASAKLPYKLEGCIGDGHDGQVVLASTPMAGKVALKLVPEKNWGLYPFKNYDEVSVCRLIQALKRLAPEHYTDCLGSGLVQRSVGSPGFKWYAMELAEGCSLRGLLEHQSRTGGRHPQLGDLQASIMLTLRIFEAVDVGLRSRGAVEEERALRYFQHDLGWGNIIVKQGTRAVTFVDYDAIRACSMVPALAERQRLQVCDLCHVHRLMVEQLFSLFLGILTFQTTVDGVAKCVSSWRMPCSVECTAARMWSEELTCRWFERTYEDKCSRGVAVAGDASHASRNLQPTHVLEEVKRDTEDLLAVVYTSLPREYREDWRRLLPLGLERAFTSAQSLEWPPQFIFDLRRALAGL